MSEDVDDNLAVLGLVAAGPLSPRAVEEKRPGRGTRVAVQRLLDRGALYLDKRLRLALTPGQRSAADWARVSRLVCSAEKADAAGKRRSAAMLRGKARAVIARIDRRNARQTNGGPAVKEE